MYGQYARRPTVIPAKAGIQEPPNHKNPVYPVYRCKTTQNGTLPIPPRYFTASPARSTRCTSIRPVNQASHNTVATVTDAKTR